MDQGAFEQATETCKKAIEINSSHPGVYRTLANLCIVNEDYSSAMDHFQEAIRVDKTFRPTFFSLAQFIAGLEQVKYNSAIDLALKLIQEENAVQPSKIAIPILNIVKQDPNSLIR